VRATGDAEEEARGDDGVLAEHAPHGLRAVTWLGLGLRLGLG
jgi:hypothetical protein